MACINSLKCAHSQPISCEINMNNAFQLVTLHVAFKKFYTEELVSLMLKFLYNLV